MRKNCKTYAEWLLSQYYEFINLESDHLHWVRDNHGSTCSMIIYHTLKDKQGRVSFKRKTLREFCGDNQESALYFLVGAAWANYKGEKVPAQLTRKRVQIGTLKAGDAFYNAVGTKCFIVGTHPYSTYHFITVDAIRPCLTRTYEAVEYVDVEI